MIPLIRSQIADLIRSAITSAQQSNALPDFAVPAIELARPKVAAHGDYSSNVAMTVAKAAKLAPQSIAAIIVTHIPPTEFISKIEVAAPGYLNITLADAWLADQSAAIVREGPTWANLPIGHGKRVQVEHGSANPTGPLTIGSGRNITIGDTLANLFEAAG